MALVLEGNTLGEKHKHYNKLVKEVIESKKPLEAGEFGSGGGDVDTFLKIDIASNDRNVEYVLEVLKSEDMLYVSRAIKRCTWLITDPHYAHIVNPDYLHTQLFPQMTTKATTIFLKHIRLHLKDETRAEEFYKKEEDVQKAGRWLPNCSAEFIEQNVLRHLSAMKTRFLKRLCEKSMKVLEIVIKDRQYCERQLLEATKFLLNVDAARYLDLIEKRHRINFPKFGAKTTELLMKQFPDRIIDKFDIYNHYIDMEIFVKYIKSRDVKKFLYDQVTKATDRYSWGRLFNFENLKLLIFALPKKERFPFVNDVFINKVHSEADDVAISKMYAMRRLYCIVSPRTPVYKFYEFAPFETAFAEIKKIIHAESSPFAKSSMLEVLLTCAGRNMQHIKTVLQYYREKHCNDRSLMQLKFVDGIITHTDFHKYDEHTWNILDDIYKSMDVYIESGDYKRLPVESIIIYKVLHDSKVPETVEKQFQFNTLETYQKRLNQEEKDKIFNYLYKRSVTLASGKVTDDKEFKEAVEKLESILQLLLAWKKELNDYPWVLDKIKEFVKLKKDNSWDLSLSSLYEKNKSWKKLMFEESLSLCPSEEVCVNVLKHDSGVLVRHKSEVEALGRKDCISLDRLLSKLRIYWPESLAREWEAWYLRRLNQLDGHRALMRGLCALLSRQQLLDIIRKYAPKEAQIDWNQTNELELSLQRHIAKNMHCARPQPPPDAILMYAKGDYLQYALPSLLAIFYNLNPARTRECISKLLDAPVSIQKHGARIAFAKLGPDELKQIFPDIWKITKNASIRAVIFKFTYDLMCKERDETRLRDIWKSLDSFIDSLTFEEDKKIYELFTVDKVSKVPLGVRPEYLIKSYEFSKRLCPHLKGNDADQCKYNIVKLVEYATELVQLLPSKFVVDVLLEYIDEKFLKHQLTDSITTLIAAYLLRIKDESTQSERFKTIMVPLMQSCFAAWTQKEGRDNFIQKNFQRLLEVLRDELKYAVANNMIIPVAMFSNIQKELNKLSVPENYMMLTKWKLVVELTNLVYKYKSDSDWDVVCSKLAPEFGDACLRMLKEDVKLYFPCIYLLFAKNLTNTLDGFIPYLSKCVIYEHMTLDEECIEAYLALVKEFPAQFNIQENEKAKQAQLKSILIAHPSIEVKMHCYHKFKRLA